MEKMVRKPILLFQQNLRMWVKPWTRNMRKKCSLVISFCELTPRTLFIIIGLRKKISISLLNKNLYEYYNIIISISSSFCQSKSIFTLAYVSFVKKKNVNFLRRKNIFSRKVLFLFF